MSKKDDHIFVNNSISISKVSQPIGLCFIISYYYNNITLQP